MRLNNEETLVDDIAGLLVWNVITQAKNIDEIYDLSEKLAEIIVDEVKKPANLEVIK